MSFALGQFPDEWKFANVIPVFKKDEWYFKNNYCPVSLLPSLSKICEKIILACLYDFLMDIGFLHPFQSGFCPWPFYDFSTQAFYSSDLPMLGKWQRS
jgi:hypothetical protein